MPCYENMENSKCDGVKVQQKYMQFCKSSNKIQAWFLAYSNTNLNYVTLLHICTTIRAIMQ